MALISAVLFVCFFRLNDWLFDWLQYTKGVNWVFLPAGFRVILVLALGIPGALGIALGTLWLDTRAAVPPAADVLVITCLASGFAPWLVKLWMERRGTLGLHLERLSSSSLLHFVLIYAIVNALLHQSIRWFFEPHTMRLWANLWPMFVGDILGALLVLYALKMCLPWLTAPLREKI